MGSLSVTAFFSATCIWIGVLLRDVKKKKTFPVKETDCNYVNDKLYFNVKRMTCT